MIDYTSVYEAGKMQNARERSLQMQSYSLFYLNIFLEFILDVSKFKRLLKEQKSVMKSTALVLKDIGLWKQVEGELLELTIERNSTSKEMGSKMRGSLT